MTRNAINVLAVLAIVGTSACARKDEAPTDSTAAAVTTQSLYDRLGGTPAITSVVDGFVANVAADTRINKFFSHVASDTAAMRQFRHQTPIK